MGLDKNLNIVKATKADTNEIMKLYDDNRFGPADWDEGYPGIETIEFDLVRDALFVCKNEKGEILATVSLDEDDEVDDLPNWNPDLMPMGEVSRLCVREDYRGHGLAKEMMKYACTEWKARGMKGIHILVRKGHPVARRAYEAVGYTMAGECVYAEKEFDCMEIAL